MTNNLNNNADNLGASGSHDFMPPVSGESSAEVGRSQSSKNSEASNQVDQAAREPIGNIPKQEDAAPIKTASKVERFLGGPISIIARKVGNAINYLSSPLARREALTRKSDDRNTEAKNIAQNPLMLADKRAELIQKERELKDAKSLGKPTGDIRDNIQHLKNVIRDSENILPKENTLLRYYGDNGKKMNEMTKDLGKLKAAQKQFENDVWGMSGNVSEAKKRFLDQASNGYHGDKLPDATLKAFAETEQKIEILELKIRLGSDHTLKDNDPKTAKMEERLAFLENPETTLKEVVTSFKEQNWRIQPSDEPKAEAASKQKLQQAYREAATEFLWIGAHAGQIEKPITLAGLQQNIREKVGYVNSGEISGKEIAVLSDYLIAAQELIKHTLEKRMEKQPENAALKSQYDRFMVAYNATEPSEDDPEAFMAMLNFLNDRENVWAVEIGLPKSEYEEISLSDEEPEVWNSKELDTEVSTEPLASFPEDHDMLHASPSVSEFDLGLDPTAKPEAFRDEFGSDEMSYGTFSDSGTTSYLDASSVEDSTSELDVVDSFPVDDEGSTAPSTTETSSATEVPQYVDLSKMISVGGVFSDNEGKSLVLKGDKATVKYLGQNATEPPVSKTRKLAIAGIEMREKFGILASAKEAISFSERHFSYEAEVVPYGGDNAAQLRDDLGKTLHTSSAREVPTQFQLLSGDTVENLRKIQEKLPEDEGRKVAAVNCANDTLFGSVWKTGGSQEEQVFRKSNLSALAGQFQALRDGNEHHIPVLGAMYVKNAAFMNPVDMKLPVDERSAFFGDITFVAALDLSKGYVRQEVQEAADAADIPFDTFVKYVTKMKYAAALGSMLENGVTDVLMSLPGTGSFQNPLGMVQEVLQELLFDAEAPFKDLFATVNFNVFGNVATASPGDRAVANMLRDELGVPGADYHGNVETP